MERKSIPENEIQPGLMHEEKKTDSASIAEEILTANPISGNKSRRISEITSDKILGLGEEDKFVLQGVMRRGEQSRRVSLIERPYDNPERIIKIWKKFKEIGLPVVSTMRQIENGSLLLTNLKADGSEIFGKGYCLAIKNGSLAVENGNGKPEKAFLRVTEPTEISSIEQKALEFAALASEHDIELPIDDPFELRVRPDGRWEVVILDLRSALLGDGGTDLKFRNERAVETFMLFLKNIRDVLLSKNDEGSV